MTDVATFDMPAADSVNIIDVPLALPECLAQGMSGAGNRAKPRLEHDFYRSPPSVAQGLLSVERFMGPIHEPACGDGAISQVLEDCGHTVVSEDLIDRGFGAGGVDFLARTRAPGNCPNLVTNPPFALADEFALHALELGYAHICLFARLAWLEGAARHKKLWRKHPPSRIWVFSKRQTLWRGDEPSPGKGGTLAFAWFVWQRGFPGTQMAWLP